MVMDVRNAYNNWAAQYDTNENKTRDLEAHALRAVCSQIDFKSCLEIGCGTGKNSVWLANRAEELVAVDFSEEMLAHAREKVKSPNAYFVQADINQPWTFISQPFELTTFSLVLEHIENLDAIFEKAAQATVPGGHVYIGELHPFKQYSGSKARFETDGGTQVVTCFNHHISDFTMAAKKHGFTIVLLDETFDDDNRSATPRLLILLLQKQQSIT